MEDFEARKIIRSSRSGGLGSIDRDTGAPYVSFCAMAHDYSAEPIFLFSDLADHTQNILNDDRVSFLCEKASHLSNPQAGARVTLVGKMVKTSNAHLTSLFLQTHPSAKMYAKFGDFNFYTLVVERAHFVGGFGRARWMDRLEYLGESLSSLEFSQKQTALVESIEHEFPTFALHCATKLLKHRGKNWQVLRVDGDGVDLKLGAKVVRYPFEKPLKTRDEVLENIAKLYA
jgi:heme iron utilization protein